MADTVSEEIADTGPATKKVRGKYTTQACIQCRQRKLKCSGENPCHTCVRRRRNCVFSDDRAVSEFLKQARKHLTADALEGDVSIEARVGRLEAEMQMVAQKLQTQRPDNSHFSETVDDVDSEITYAGETALHTPAHAFTENVQQIKERMGIPDGIDKSPRTVVSPHMTLHDEPSVTSQVQVQIGSRELPFPDQQSYNDYLDFFFDDINPCHPCVNEAAFRSRSERMLARREVQKNETCFLALHYVMFALADILRDVLLLEKRALPLGRRWYKHADDLVGKIKYSGHGDLSLLQYLVFEALYLTHEDRPNAAYNIAGLICRLCFQFGLHQQSRWPEDAHTYGRHMKERIFWTAYFVDRRIALSCGRPYGMNDRDIDVDLPAHIADKDLYLDQPLPAANPETSSMVYLTCMIAFAKFSGEVWDNMFSAASTAQGFDARQSEMATVLDAKIRYWLDAVLPGLPILPFTFTPSKQHLRQQLLVSTRFAQLRLLLRRRLMTSLTYAAHDAEFSGALANDIVSKIAQLSEEATQPSSFRFHMAASLGGALLVLSTLLYRPLDGIGLQDSRDGFADSFQVALSLLRQLATGLLAARRIMDDLKDITNVVSTLITRSVTITQQSSVSMSTGADALFPYTAADFAQQSGYPYENLMMDDATNYSMDSWSEWNDFMAAEPVGPQGYGAHWL
ncbi:hypothetical protein LTR27_006232 [Elasticomyces elasticus]|nr:hypothetical protein LTR27_006232 [Elasticomyces elasticus]